MIRIAWKQILYPGFILFLIFSGCGKKEATIEELILQAEDLQNVGQFDAAIVLLEKGLEREPNRADLLEELAFAHAANQDPMLAAMNFMRIAELVPDQPEYLIYAANSMKEAGDLVGAVNTYQQYLEDNPSDRGVWLILAQLHKERGNLGGALEAYLAADKIAATADQQIEIARLYLRANNLVQAQAWFARALKGDSEYRDDALLGLLETAVRSKRFAEAYALLQQLDAEYPGVVDQSPLSQVRDQLAEWNRRREAAKTALAEFEARDTEELQNAVETADSAEAGDVEEQAVETEQPAVAQTPAATQQRSSPTRSSARQNRAATQPRPAAQRPQEPPIQLADNRDLQPKPVQQDNKLAMARQRRDEGKTDEAIQLYKTALIENDNQPAVWSELSSLYLQAGNNRWAQATASEAMRRDPENPQYALQYLRSARQAMDSSRFVREMETIYKRFPENPDLLIYMGKIFADQGNLRNARILLEKFLEFAPAGHPQRSTAEMELSDLGNGSTL